MVVCTVSVSPQGAVGAARPCALRPKPLEVVPRLRVLGLVASPRGLPALDVAAEQPHLSQALRWADL